MPSLRSPSLRALQLVLVAALSGGACSYRTELQPAPPQAESTRILAADGTVLAALHGTENREQVRLGAVSQKMRDAVVAIEDSRFYSHRGVDPKAVLRAGSRNALQGRVAEGGSTITQQYVKNALLGPERTVGRKVREASLAYQLERRHSKQTILERYLNTIYLGGGAYGVQAAASLYFDKPAADLDLAESALLAGLIRAPERYDPYDHPERALERRATVLERLVELGKAEAGEAAAAKAAPLRLAPRQRAERYAAGHFVELVKREVLADGRLGPTREARRRRLLQGGLRVATTLDPRLQRLAEEAVRGVLPDPAVLPNSGGPSAALVALDPGTGAIRALVGGPDFFGDDEAARFDLATQGRRQTGSAFKPIVLAAALAQGVPLDRRYEAPSSLSLPQPEGQPNWEVENYEGSGGGVVDLTEATVASLNTVYAQLVTDVGAKPAVELAASMGITSPLRPYPSAVLGTNEVTVLDMASAYGTLAADGLHSKPSAIERVTRPDGSLVFERSSTRQRVLPAQVARQVNRVLEQVVSRGTGIRARLDRPVAGKTGTAQAWRDAWFVGYTPDLAVAVWVGFADGQRSMTPPTTPLRVTGGSWPAQIWAAFAGPALAGTPARGFPAPEGPPSPQPPVPIAVPRVVGSAQESAVETLRRAGFLVVIEPRPSRRALAGLIIETLPAEARALPGSTIVLMVSSGPPRTVIVPDLRGQPAEEAVDKLRRLGLATSVVVEEESPGGTRRPFRGGAGPGRVWGQAPTPGASVDEGDPVRLWVER